MEKPSENRGKKHKKQWARALMLPALTYPSEWVQKDCVNSYLLLDIGLVLKMKPRLKKAKKEKNIKLLKYTKLKENKNYPSIF